MAAETAKVSELESRITELKNQLEELTQSKKTQETELLEKFCGLLNEKKVKIREQQRLLSTAQVDPSRLAAARAAQATRPNIQEDEKPAPSRRAKRKALEDASGGGSSDSDDGFEKVNPAADKMDVDEQEPPPKESPEFEDRQTTDDDATGSEPDDEEPTPPSPPPAKSRQPQKPAPRGRAAPASQAAKDKGVTILPKRALRKTTPKAATPPPAEGSETESDDEL